MEPVESVLCCARADLPSAWLPRDGAIPVDEDTLASTLAPVTPHWVPRPHAEKDPALKQLIPYVLLEDHRGHLAAYPRRGGESRLHGLLSLGVGGHINTCDAPEAHIPGGRFWTSVLRKGLARELAEEFPQAVDGTTTLLGLINEDVSPVGRVHLGVVYHHRIPNTPATPPGELAGLAWIARTQLGTTAAPLRSFERWSQLALTLLP